MIVNHLKPPYYAAIFTSLMSNTPEGYSEMGKYMAEIAMKQKGFLGIESAKNEVGITVSYWKDEASILGWKNNIEHLKAQYKGKEMW